MATLIICRELLTFGLGRSVLTTTPCIDVRSLPPLPTAWQMQNQALNVGLAGAKTHSSKWGHPPYQLCPAAIS